MAGEAEVQYSEVPGGTEYGVPGTRYEVRHPGEHLMRQTVDQPTQHSPDASSRLDQSMRAISRNDLYISRDFEVMFGLRR